MATVGQGLMKMHHHGHGNGGNGNNRGKKPYGLMILLAFGLAIIAVMVLHKVRERRIFNLLVNEKDLQLTSLHLLLQKEREEAKEAKWKVQEMKTKINTLRAQKRGLDSKIAEMQSTIFSLKEEQRTIESTLDEKQNEIKQMRERYTEDSNDNPQVIALSEMLRQKESEVEDLKNRLETPSVKVWSVSTDDPSSANMNSQTTTRETERDDTKAAGLQERTTHEAEKNATELGDRGNGTSAIRHEQDETDGKDTRREGGDTVDSSAKISEQTEKGDDSQHIVSKHGNAEEEHKNSNETQTEEGSGIQEQKSQIQAGDNNAEPTFKDNIHEGHSTGNEVLQTTEDRLQGRHSDSQGAEIQESGMSHQAGMKLEMSNTPRIGRELDVEGHLRKIKRKKLNKEIIKPGKTWRTL